MWRCSTRPRGRPFARAVRTYSRDSTSSTLLRRYRLQLAIAPNPSTTAGITRWRSRSAADDSPISCIPATGSSRRCTASTSCSINPNQNVGIAHAKNDPNDSRLSPHEYLCVAAKMPSGNDRPSASTNALSIRTIVAGSRSPIIASTGRPV